MTRRELIALAAAPAVVRPRTGAPANPFRDYSRCLPDYLRAQANQAYLARKRALDALNTPGAVAERQHWVSQTFWKLVGGMPEKTPLNARTIGTLEREGYRLEKLVYESRPGLILSANLYIPTAGRPPYPGVLVQMGHTVNGKAGYQRICQGLARLGFLVLGFDPMGQGERTYYPGPEPFRTRIDPDEEHTRPGRQMLLFGDTSTRLQVWDSVRSLDYLASHPLVDPKRLASTGQSGGGTTTMLLAAVDPRLSVAAVSCGNTENVACADFDPPGSTDDGEQNFVASGPAGFDRWDLLYPLAPKPLLVLVSDHDFFGTYSPNYLTSGTEEFAHLQRIYRTLGAAPERLAWASTALPHGLAYDMRMHIYRWLVRWMQPGAAPVTEEPPTASEPDPVTWVTASGSVVRSLSSATPFTLNRDRVRPARIPLPLPQLLKLQEPPGKAAVRVARATFREAAIDVLEFASAPSVWIPAWLYRPRREDAAQPLVVVVDPNGRGAWREDDLYDQLSRRGAIVCAPDLRGFGDLTPEYPRHAARHARDHAGDEAWAWSSLILGRPLAGQRVADLLAVIRGLRRDPALAQRRLVLAARGPATVPTLFAAAIEPAVSALYLAGGLISFENLVHTEDYQHPFGNFVPDLLLHTDLPELVSGLAPRPVTIAGAVNGAGQAVATNELQREYADARHVKVLERAAWDAGSLLTM